MRQRRRGRAFQRVYVGVDASWGQPAPPLRRMFLQEEGAGGRCWIRSVSRCGTTPGRQPDLQLVVVAVNPALLVPTRDERG